MPQKRIRHAIKNEFLSTKLKLQSEITTTTKVLKSKIKQESKRLAKQLIKIGVDEALKLAANSILPGSGEIIAVLPLGSYVANKIVDG